MNDSTSLVTRSVWREALVPAGVVFTLALVAHHQILGNGFVNIDDQLYVTGSARVQAGLTPGNLAWAFTAFDAYNWHPLTWISHMTDVEIWGLDARLHHLTSLVLHALNAVLLLLFLRRSTGAPLRSVAVAAIFAVHPIHVESVAWIAERKDVLFCFFYLATLLVYVSPRFPGSRWRMLFALLLFAASLMAKPMAVSLPVILLLLDWWPLGHIRLEPAAGRDFLRGLGRSLVHKTPFFALSVVDSALTFMAQHKEGQGTVLYESPIGLNARNAVVSYVRYLGKAIWPVDLAVMYPFRGSDLTLAATSGATGLLLVLLGTGWWLRRRYPYVLFGLLWFLVTLVPVIGAVRIGRHAIADRYAYISFIGVYVALVWALADTARGLRVRRRPGMAIGFLVVCGLAIASIRQSKVWRSSRTLFQHALNVTRDNAVAHLNFGNALASEGDYPGAARHGAMGRMLEARDVVELHPANPLAHYRLGNAYAEMGLHPEAIESFGTVVRLAPSFPGVWNNLGVSLANLGRLDEARAAFSEAMRINPSDASARENLEALGRPIPKGNPAQAGRP